MTCPQCSINHYVFPERCYTLVQEAHAVICPDGEHLPICPMLLMTAFLTNLKVKMRYR